MIFFLYEWAVAISLLVHSDALEFSDEMKRNIDDDFMLRAIIGAKASPQNTPSSSNQ